MLIRMIGSIPRWDGSQKIERDDALFTGDAIADLRTQGNTLSVWYSKDGSDLNDILVALALSRSRIEKLCYVILDDDYITNLNISLDKKPGLAPGLINKQILEKHRDLTDIDYWRLGLIAEHIYKRVKENHKDVVTKFQLETLIRDYINNGIVDVSQLTDGIRTSLKL